jgi:hypothetical protein
MATTNIVVRIISGSLYLFSGAYKQGTLSAAARDRLHGVPENK